MVRLMEILLHADAKFAGGAQCETTTPFITTYGLNQLRYDLVRESCAALPFRAPIAVLVRKRSLLISITILMTFSFLSREISRRTWSQGRSKK
jgi:hypothetical protein